MRMSIVNSEQSSMVRLAGIGSYLPGEPVPFCNISKILGELDKASQKIQRWIDKTTPIMQEMLGIEYYHYAIDPATREFTEDNMSMALKASEKAMINAGVTSEDIDLIVYGGPYMFEMPSPSAKLQALLGIASCSELSIHSNCTSIYKAILVAFEMLQSGRYETALVATSNMSSSTLRAEYYNQEIVSKEDLFLRWYLCDGAGAVVLKRETGRSDGYFLEKVYMESVGGNKPSAMYMRYPSYYVSPKEAFDKGYHHLVQAFQDELGRNFHEEGGTVFYKGLCRMIEKYQIDTAEIACLQINMPTKHVVELVADEISGIGISKDKVFTALNQTGYAGPPAAIISLDKLLQTRIIPDNQCILSFVSEVSKFLQAGFTIRNCRKSA